MKKEHKVIISTDDYQNYLDNEILVEELRNQLTFKMQRDFNNSIADSVKVLVNNLKQDKDYYRSWQANIAMAFKDEYNNTIEVFKQDIHTIANRAADNFLKLLCKDVSE